MRLELTNVGKIRKADVELNGVTVIAGENNTGKSTVGKMLFCVFHSFYRIEEQISEERQKTIARVLANYYHETAHRLTRGFDTADFAKDISDKKEQFLSDTRVLRKEIEEFYLKSDSYFRQYLNYDSLEQLADKIYGFLLIKDEEIRKAILQKRLVAEFGIKIGYLDEPDEKTKVNLNIKNGNICFEVTGNEDIVIKKQMSLMKEILYIDDPFVLDNLNSKRVLNLQNQFGHNGDLLKKIVKEENTLEFGVVDELVGRQKLKNIFEAMDGVCDGDLMLDEGGSYVYKTHKLKESLGIMNLSTGMKSFVILRKLLQNGSIDENGVIILDEPEIHLHPEWQLKFAEVIVLIQREFGVNILLNTHSPYFLNAIEVYSEKYGIEKKCKYYLTNEENGRVDILDVTEDRESIYEKLARPLQELENLEYRNGNTLR